MIKFQDLPACQTGGELIERYLGIALEKQIAFEQLIDGQKWSVDLAQGIFVFGEYVLPTQLIGTFAHDLQTWLWAWANPDPHINGDIIQDAFMVKEYGDAQEIDLLRNGEFPFTPEGMDSIGMIVSGITNASAYHIIKFNAVLMLLTVKSEAIDKIHQNDPQNMMRVFSQAIQMAEMNHRGAFYCYLLAKGYEVSVSDEDEEDYILGELEGNVLVGYFDEESRLIEMTTELS